jgi:hypothetical protein
VRRKQRGDLWYFETTSAPRPDDLCARYVGKIAPWWGFAVYGIAFLVLAWLLLVVGVLLGIGVSSVLGVAKGSTLAGVFAWTFGVATFALSWWPFARWVKRRRGAALPLLRDGELIDGVVVDKFAGSALDVVGRVATDYVVSQIGGVKFYRVAIEHGGQQHMLKIPISSWSIPAARTNLKVLFNPATKYVLVFDEAGKARVAKRP